MAKAKKTRSVQLRLADIRGEIALLRAMMARHSVPEILADPILLRATERCFMIISEASRHVPEEMRLAEPKIPWADIRGIGNFVRHEYDALDQPVLAAILEKELDPLDTACARLQARYPA